LHPHLVFETLSYFVAFRVYLSLRRRFGDPIATPIRWAVVAAAVAGAALGSKLLFLVEDPPLTWHNLRNPAYLMGGKTIVGALIGGLLTVELLKRYIGLRASTGDLYAIPLALGIAIGRIGCFLTGLSDNTYGTPTSLPWAIDFGDTIPRHPTQIYEIAFLLALIPILYRVLNNVSIQNKTVILSGAVTKRSEVTAQSKACPELVEGDPYPSTSTNPVSRHSPHALDQSARVPTTNAQQPPTPLLPGDAFKFFMVAYLSFRFFCDFLKPYPRIFLGLGTIQWACVAILLYYFHDVARWLAQRRRPVPQLKPIQ
jgi:phosphatidylglycerol:prolipoprotein diacylglycerol transferase